MVATLATRKPPPHIHGPSWRAILLGLSQDLSDQDDNAVFDGYLEQAVGAQPKPPTLDDPMDEAYSYLARRRKHDERLVPLYRELLTAIDDLVLITSGLCANKAVLGQTTHKQLATIGRLQSYHKWVFERKDRVELRMENEAEQIRQMADSC